MLSLLHDKYYRQIGELIWKLMPIDAKKYVVEYECYSTTESCRVFWINKEGKEKGYDISNAWSVSGFASGERGKSSYKQVNEQAGLFAGDGGYHVEANNTHLTAGAIASTNPNNSELSTNRFTFEDIRNESSHKATSASISGSYGRGEDYYVDKDSGKLSKKGAENATFVEGKTAPSFTPGLPMHSQGSDSSKTRATLTEGKITLNKDTTPTQTSANALGINTDLSQANSQVEKPKEVKKLLSEQKEIAQAVGHISSAVQTYTTNKQAEAAQKVKEAKKALEQAQTNPNTSSSEIEAKLTALFEATQAQKQWDNNGTYHRTAQVLTTVVTGILANQSAGAIATQSLSPKVNELIKQATTDEQGNVDVLTNTLAHALWGAIEAVAANGNATAGAVSAATAELAAPALAKLLYNKTEASQLTAEERQHIITLSSIAGAVAGGVTSQASNQSNTAANTVQNAALGGEIGKSAVENNYLSHRDVYTYQQALKKAIEKGESVEEVHKYFKALSEKQRAELLADCEMDCRVTVPQTLLGAVSFADDLSGALNSWLQGLPFEEQSKFYQLVEAENLKTIEAIKEKQTGIEKGIELAMDASRLFGKENSLGNSNTQNNFAKKNTSRTSSPIPVPNPVDVHLEDGVSVKYKSHSKHTKGMPGNRKNAGIEPRESLELFKNSIEYKVEGNKIIRYAKDSQGNVHRFFGTNGEYHWSGSSGDPDNPLSIPKDLKFK